ncbi:immunoglobulin-like domain-containing protein [Clostridium aminobutyricum]|uniref:S-layer homology domain-containing protein n=1 Tax=Clostridium aminobutyricum TaxID=33953 RepID=A0A939IK45_CLOAM|nr:immunoglobulin-like domain-containing protein [Clostridium aminobutyricum]MBN7774224.1 S-layer homology domain-containing protein [Clostridium aminobutyricum]
MKKKGVAIFLTLMLCLNLLPTISLADTLDLTQPVMTDENDIDDNVENEPVIDTEHHSDSGIENERVKLQSGGSVWDGSTLTKPEVDEKGEYQIANGENLAWFAALVNNQKVTTASAVLINDITLSAETPVNWTPIGSSANQYIGKFDGAGYTISGLLMINGTAANQGLFGYVGSTGVIKNVAREGSLEAGGESAGGIVGYNAGSMENCFNKATISSTKKYVGGIAGSNYGNIVGCYNVGNVSGKSDTGGIIGQNRASSLSNCYNLGKVESTGSNTGGLVGYGYVGTISNCYNVGEVKSTSTSNVGAAIGFKGPSAVIKSIYYDNKSYTVGVGNDSANTNAIAKSSNYMKTNDFVAELGGSFVADTTPNQNSGYPILGWQDPNAKYIVAFEINQGGAEVTVEDADGEAMVAEADGTYKLSNGTYLYRVTKDEFDTVEDHFTVNNGGKKITVNLVIKTYAVDFEGMIPSDAAVIVKNSEGQTVSGSSGHYTLPKGSYTYTIEKFGFHTLEGSFTVNGTAVTIPNIVLAETPRSRVHFDVSFADGNSSAAAIITLKHGNEVQSKGENGSYRLPDGDYSYTIACNGYKTITGSIAVNGEELNIQKTMEVRGVWSGASEEPTTVVKDGKTYYQIVNSENLAWFSNHVSSGNVTANAILIGNLILSNEEKSNIWTSIGSNVNPYAGTFDGQGYKISGLKGTNGLFTYSQAGSTVKNVMVEGEITQATSNVGGIMGVNYGSISNCSFSGSIVATGQRVGGIAGNNSAGIIENCVNYASIKTSTTLFSTELDVGGIAGLSYGIISNCYNAGNISGSCPGSGCGEIGGITGKSTNEIQNCYNVGTITKEKESMGKIGAVAGSTTGSVKNCYYLTNSFSTGLGSGTGDAVGKSTSEIKDNDFVTTLGNAFNKDYSGDQAINNGYPVLKWQGGTEAGPNLDVEAVAKDRTALEITNLIIAETGTINLPRAGENGTTITWFSSNPAVITQDGAVTLPLTGNVKVTLTATITKGKISDTKQFELTVKSQEEATKDYLDKANTALTNVKVIKPTFGTDTNIVSVVQKKLDALGYSGISVSLLNNVNEKYIAPNGDITYFYTDPNLNDMLNFGQVSDLQFALNKNQQSVNCKLAANIWWDQTKVIQTMTDQIADKLTFDLIKGQNQEMTNITKDLCLPQLVDERKWVTISWESNSTYVNILDSKGIPYSDLTGKITTPEEDTEVTLTATITFNKTNSMSGEADIRITKTFDLSLQGDNSVDWLSYMQTQLDANYTINKLKVSSSGKIIEPDKITDDIQLLTPKNTGIENYSNYNFTVSSSDPSTIKINGYRAVVYRPLPGETAKTVILTVCMQRKNTDTIVTKDFTLTVQPILQDEIDKEIALMEMVKANYATGILNGMSADHVTKSLRAFQECYLNDQNELVWIYNYNNRTDTGIQPYDLPKEGYDESYNLYHSSKPTIIQHENLVLASTPKDDTEVTITSNLQSIRFAKYAEKYPNDENFKKLVNQIVTATVIVKGNGGAENPNPDIPDVEANVTIKAQVEGTFVVAPQDVNVDYRLAEDYGYPDTVENHVSTLDALVKAHELIFGKEFTKDTRSDFLQVGSNGNISILFGVETSNNGFAVNGKAPNDGVYNETYQGYTGYTINQAQVKDNDVVDFFIYQDAIGYSDYYAWFEEGSRIEATSIVPFTVSLKGFCFAVYGMKDANEINQNKINLTGIQLALVNGDGQVIPIENAVTDANGSATLSLPKGTYSLTAIGNESTKIILPFSTIVVGTGEQLQAAKTAAIQELNTYKNISEYRAAQQTELEEAINRGTAVIQDAGTVVLVNKALLEAKTELDAIKTNAQLTIEERIAAEQDAYNAIYQSLTAYKGGTASSITISIPYTGTGSEIQKNIINLYLNVLFEHPELFYVRTEYSIDIEGKTATLYPSIIGQFKEAAALTTAKTDFNDVVTSAVENCILPGMTDVEKLLALHDWLVDHCQYNQQSSHTGSADTLTAYTAYGAMVDGDAVCQGYSLAMNLLLEKAGVPSYYVSGNDHSWNVVKIAGRWYHVDSTWADSTPDRPGEVKHQYFLLSDSEIKDASHHSKWENRYDIKCPQSYAGDTPWLTSTLPFTYDTNEKAFFNVENQNNGTKYRKISFNSEGNATVQVLQNIGLENIRSQAEYNGILYLVDNTGDVYAYDVKKKVKKLILDETVAMDPGYGVLIRNQKLIIRAYYQDVEELELYKEDPVSIVKPTAVVTFMPAPGQFINKEEMLYNAYPNPEVTLENPLSEKVVSLGAYGGYIVYGFDTPITNDETNAYGIDFIVYGNSGNGNSEPAAVMVSQDGKTWYELAGSEYYNADTKRNLTVTYTNPDTSFTKAADVAWSTSDGKSGVVYKNNTHQQPYYPNPKTYDVYNTGIGANPNYSNTSLSFAGNKISVDGTPSFGYADSHATGSNNIAVNPYKGSIGTYNGDGMDLAWAVDENGNPVKINSAKYVKIYTAVLQDNGVMGETSSEIAGILKAQSKENAVGKTEDLKEIIINGQTISLQSGQYQYVVDAANAKSLNVKATGTSTDNLFINNKRVASGTYSEPLAVADKVRIIVQNGEKEPIIYMIHVTGTDFPNNSEVELNNYISDLVITKLPNKTVYKVGESLDTAGMVVKAKYISDGKGSLKEIDINNCSINGFDSSTAGALSVKVAYYEDYYDDNHNFIKRINTSAIFVVNVKAEQADPVPEKEQSVVLTIKGANGKTWTSNSYVINPGVTTVMDALKAVLALNGTTYTIKAGGKYISSIDGLAEFDLGKNSGWMVTVDNYLIDVSAADWKLNGSEKIVWFYTEDWTKVSGTKGWVKEEEVVEKPALDTTKTVTSTVKVEVKVDKSGQASASIGSKDINTAITDVLKKAEAAEKQGDTVKKEVVIEVKADSTAKRVETTIAKEAAKELNDKVDAVTLTTPIGDITFDRQAFAFLLKQEAGDLKLTVIKTEADDLIAGNTALSEKAKSTIQKGKVFEITISAGTKQISQLEGNVMLRIPYERTEDQKREAIVAYVLTKDGTLKPVIKGKMENDGNLFKMPADQCSTYVIAYNDMNFDDTKNHWADTNITYLGAREVVKGMTESTFAPNATITRAQFVQILANINGEDLSQYTDTAFDDVKATDWYSASALWAKKAGIAQGANGKFDPNTTITRQDMAVMITRYAANVDRISLNTGDYETTFSDSSTIASYAVEAVKGMKAAGIINGVQNSQGTYNFNPGSSATRAETATMIVNYLKR